MTAPRNHYKAKTIKYNFIIKKKEQGEFTWFSSFHALNDATSKYAGKRKLEEGSIYFHSGDRRHDC